LADCAGAAALLVDEGTRRGLEVRFSYGLVIAPPFSSAHCWAEFHVADRGVPVEPMMVSTLLKWGLLDPQRWTATRSVGAILCRLEDEALALGMHCGELLDPSWPTQYQKAPVQAPA
jgi:hypothetical protein